MVRIRRAEWLAPSVRRLILEAPRIARRHQPGHFVIVRSDGDAERIPLTIADSDPGEGTITLVVQSIGAATERITALGTGDSFADVAGPMGKATEIERYGHVVLVGGGVGTAVVYPQARALRAVGNALTAIIGGRSRPYVILEQELTQHCDRVLPCTDDGSHGFHGFVTKKLAELIANGEAIDMVITAGPVPMMGAVAEVTRPANIRTVASLNPIMVDGTGMCGGCRVDVGGKQMFACVDGPEFDAHLVNFRSLSARLAAYREHEQKARERLAADHDHRCRLDAALRELEASEAANARR
jgi:ferredoxin--NADP+ reductase